MDDFDFTQFPDFPELFPDLSDDLFDQPVTEDQDGIIECPFLATRDMVLFPQMVMPLFVGRERSLAAINAANNNRENLIVAAQRDNNIADPKEVDLFAIGTEASIGRILRMPDDTTSVLAQGRRRIEILGFTQWDPYIRVRARIVEEIGSWQPNTEALMRAVLALFEKVVDLNYNLPEETYTYALNLDEPGWLADFIASTLPVPVSTRQEVLEILDPHERLQTISILLARELEVLELEGEIQSQVQQEVDRSHREHFLREQMRIIQGELGELDVFGQELGELQEAGPLRSIVELGTGTGAFSTFLALQCLARGLAFMTVDHSEALPDNPVSELIGLGRQRVVGDIWSGGGAQVEEWLSREAMHPLVLFCDDGDKPREMRTFGPLLRVGDVLAVHDWGTEVRREHVEAVRPLLPGRRLVEMATGEMTRFWLVTEEG